MVYRRRNLARRDWGRRVKSEILVLIDLLWLALLLCLLGKQSLPYNLRHGKEKGMKAMNNIYLRRH